LSAPLGREKTPFPGVPDDPRLRRGKVGWLEPRLVADVEFSQWTDDGRVRAPSYKGLRDEGELDDAGPPREAEAEGGAAGASSG